MGLIDLHTIVLDTPDPPALARFYAALLDGQIESEQPDWITVRLPDGQGRMSFQLAPDLIAPTWPDPRIPQQVHLDFFVGSYDEPEQRALSLGARKVGDDAEHPGFRAYLDPSGHPFCLCLH